MLKTILKSYTIIGSLTWLPIMYPTYLKSRNEVILRKEEKGWGRLTFDSACGAYARFAYRVSLYVPAYSYCNFSTYCKMNSVF